LSGITDEISFKNINNSMLPEFFNELSAQIIRFAESAVNCPNDINREAFDHIQQKCFSSFNEYQLPVQFKLVLTHIRNDLNVQQASSSKRPREEGDNILMKEISADQFDALPLFLQLIINNAIVTTPGFKGNRYSEMIRDVAGLLLCRCGPKQYDIFQMNMSLPEISTVRDYIESQAKHLHEGILYIDELKNFLIQKGYPLEVGIFEDGTKVNYTALTINSAFALYYITLQ